ncbi:type II toxin-antitoxin system VapC family toxin [Jiangella asiatica]|uniref:Ribonuclease VapC n=1 Tax=Jiangella asiatica TaxID=2530372 RepID=A0A4R5DUW5_9ACTN|nr:type II toxin-antitoxin system VapC family toxin [Jiangella asiatica]TDE15015.1 PIN domain-containing protein [Jiangella asiatica]
MIVLDAGALVMLLADRGPVGTALRRRVRTERLCTPHLADVELASALLGRHRGGKLTDRELDDAWASFAELPRHRVEHAPLLPRVRELFTHLPAYDATYVALAEAYDVPLVTTDGRIVRSGRPRCPVELFDEATVSGAG